MRIGPAEQGFSGSLDVSASGKNGNTKKQEYSLDSRLQWQSVKTSNFVVLSYEYGESNERRNSNSRFLHARHIAPFRSDHAWEAYVQLEQDEFTRLSFRGLLGVGLRFTLTEKSDHIGLYLGTGIYATKETLEKRSGLNDDGSDRYYRASFYLSYKHKLNDQVSFVSTSYLQPRFDDSSDYRALEQAALSVKMSEQLSVKLSIDVSHDNAPPQGIKQTDLRYYSGISYRF